MRRFAPAFSLFLAFAAPAAAEPIDVTVRNLSRPTLCAEEDNVAVVLAHPAIRHFRVEARHPAVIGSIVADRKAPDFSNCDFGGDDPEIHKFGKRQFVFHEDDQIVLVGNTMETFWRPEVVPVTVGDRVEQPVHLLQLYLKTPSGKHQVLVLYPTDGNWRARPLPPAHLAEVGYGTSFLIGPLENLKDHPLVNIAAVAFDPAARRFTLRFRRGGTATVTIGEISTERVLLDVSFAEIPFADLPFAAIRSMFVTETNADVARAQWRGKAARRWQEAPILDLPAVEAQEIWFGRVAVSRHNTSAPDMVFGGFASAPARAAPPVAAR
jgi:hypothetical protein